MTFPVSERDRAAALEAASRAPAIGADPGFLGRFQSDREAMERFSNINAGYQGMKAAQDDFIARFAKESGQRLRPWLDVPQYPGPIWNEDAARKQFEDWKADNRESVLEFPEREFLRERAIERSRTSRDAAVRAQSRSTSVLSTLGGFTGTVVGAMQDPLNIVMLAFGANAGAGILRTAAIEGAIALGSETAIQAATFDYKREVDPTFSVGEAATEVAAAGVGGVILGGGLKGAAALWHRMQTGDWPQYVRDAGKVVTREASVPRSRYQRSASGASAHNAAVSKAIDDMANNRPVEIPQEAFLEGSARVGRVYDADGRNIGVQYEVVEAADLVTSNKDDLSVNPVYPPELQPRDRSRALSRDQINAIAGNLQPERLGPSIQAEAGAPIVGSDGIVESGNARTLALRRVYQRGGVQEQNYRAFLKSQGYDVEGMSSPVLIARRVTELQDTDRAAFTAAANRSTALRLGASEQALADARLIDPDLLSRLSEDDVGSSSNRFFVRGFMSKLPRAEQGEMIDKSGQLSQSGERRISAALLGRAYGEPNILGRVLEDADSNVRAIGGALTDAAPAWSIMRDAVARGEIPAGMDVTRDLVEAVGTIMKARDQGMPVKAMVNQAEMFGGPNEIAKIVARAMFSDFEMRRPASRKKLAAFLRDYADEAMKNDTQPRLLGDPLDETDVLRSSLQRVGREDLESLVNERLTPENIDQLRDTPEVEDAVIQEANRIIAENPDLKIDVDGEERTLDEIFDEADEEIAAAADLEGCALGRSTETAAE